MWTVVRTFTYPYEADLARLRLEACGIEVRLRDDLSVGTMSHLGPALGGIKLEVRDDQLEEATEILDTERAQLAPELGPHRSPGERAPSDDDEPTGSDLATTEVDADLSEYDAGDEYASRAFRAACLSFLLCPGIGHVYSLQQLALLSEKGLTLSAQGESHRTWAVRLDVAGLLLVAVSLVSRYVL